jgi:hypothetical protein
MWRPTWHNAGMSAPMTQPLTDAAALRPKIVERIKQLPASDLPTIDRVLHEIEVRHLSEELGKELAEDWKSGAITEESIAEGVREHRKKHPYR